MSLDKKESRIIKAGGERFSAHGIRDCWKVGSKLIWLNQSSSQVYVGYASDPSLQGVHMSLTSALKL